jgi:uncharacterized membrane protein
MRPPYPSTAVDERIPTLPTLATPLTPHRRIALATAVGLVTGAVAGLSMPWQASILVGWIGAASVFLGWVARLVFDPRIPTKEVATRDDPGRVVGSIVDVTASVGCLAGVGLALVKANEGEGVNAALVVLAVFSVLVSWAVLHSVFLLHYAHVYYRGPDGGIEFNDDNPPRYADFAYLAFTVGMTYQVSDTALATPEMRRHALAHALLSFLFGTFILAVTINVVAGFVR